METNFFSHVELYNIEFRSYLWGMETSLGRLEYRENRPYSDPTYEAWKRSLLTHFEFFLCHSDPTYEAWKLHVKGVKEDDEFDSDPTYEAWKQVADAGV